MQGYQKYEFYLLKIELMIVLTVRLFAERVTLFTPNTQCRGHIPIALFFGCRDQGFIPRRSAVQYVYAVAILIPRCSAAG
jgi:hypothetical protein